MSGDNEVQLDYFTPQTPAPKPYWLSPSNPEWNAYLYGVVASALGAALIPVSRIDFAASFGILFAIPSIGFCFMFPGMVFRFLVERVRSKFPQLFAALFIPSMIACCFPALYAFSAPPRQVILMWIGLAIMLALADVQSGSLLGSKKTHWFLGGLIWPILSVGVVIGLKHLSVMPGLPKVAIRNLMFFCPMTLPAFMGAFLRNPTAVPMKNHL